jgi:hypothetical protein
LYMVIQKFNFKALLTKPAKIASKLAGHVSLAFAGKR